MLISQVFKSSTRLVGSLVVTEDCGACAGDGCDLCHDGSVYVLLDASEFLLHYIGTTPGALAAALRNYLNDKQPLQRDAMRQFRTWWAEVDADTDNPTSLPDLLPLAQEAGAVVRDVHAPDAALLTLSSLLRRAEAAGPMDGTAITRLRSEGNGLDIGEMIMRAMKNATHDHFTEEDA